MIALSCSLSLLLSLALSCSFCLFALSLQQKEGGGSIWFEPWFLPRAGSAGASPDALFAFSGQFRRVAGRSRGVWEVLRCAERVLWARRLQQQREMGIRTLRSLRSRQREKDETKTRPRPLSCPSARRSLSSHVTVSRKKRSRFDRESPLRPCRERSKPKSESELSRASGAAAARKGKKGENSTSFPSLARSSAGLSNALLAAIASLRGRRSRKFRSRS